MHDMCKGCLVINSACIFVKTRDQDKCPCIQCLVKMMCTKVCKERGTAGDNLMKELRHLKCTNINTVEHVYFMKEQ